MSVLSHFVEWRPASFWSHPRLVVSDTVSATRLFIRGDATGVTQLEPEDANPRHGVKTVRSDDGPRKTDWFLTNGRKDEWSVARNSPAAQNATILFVKVARRRAHIKTRPCFQGQEPLGTSLCVAKVGSGANIEWEAALHGFMKWCHFKKKVNDKGKVVFDPLNSPRKGALLKPLDECGEPKISY